jgi:glutathione synthetase
VPAYRLDWGPDVLEYTRLTESRELLFQPPWLMSKDPLEISVIYLRAGYEAAEYDLTGYEIRLRFEKSTAIKCPSVLGHITTFKKIQQALTLPGALEKFLSESDAAALRETFVPVYPLDETEAGLHGREQVHNREHSANYVLKPSLEGGGHNVYGEDIPGFLASIPKSRWSRYILMERIHSPLSSNLLMSTAGIGSGDVVSELGVLGCCLWRANTSDKGCDMLHNSVAGWTFKTKYAEVEEMSVVKGYGCFDSPRLVDI